ncbi:hypothetical protein PM082_013756 [Marasmius tenuissimus]|nr:hypothetical protein PM082_013756 [Marasmius tenuissimus]
MRHHVELLSGPVGCFSPDTPSVGSRGMARLCALTDAHCRATNMPGQVLSAEFLLRHDHVPWTRLSFEPPPGTIIPLGAK